MNDLVKIASSKSVKLILLNCEDKSLDVLKNYAEKNGASEVEYYRLVQKPTYTKYYPFHIVARDGKIIMFGGYDMDKNQWKPWEKIAGLQ